MGQWRFDRFYLGRIGSLGGRVRLQRRQAAEELFRAGCTEHRRVDVAHLPRLPARQIELERHVALAFPVVRCIGAGATDRKAGGTDVHWRGLQKCGMDVGPSRTPARTIRYTSGLATWRSESILTLFAGETRRIAWGSRAGLAVAREKAVASSGPTPATRRTATADALCATAG